MSMKGKTSIGRAAPQYLQTGYNQHRCAAWRRGESENQKTEENLTTVMLLLTSEKDMTAYDNAADTIVLEKIRDSSVTYLLFRFVDLMTYFYKKRLC